MKRTSLVFATICLFSFIFNGCIFDDNRRSDRIQTRQQEQMLLEATAQTGMPAIKNFRERKILKDILELRDQEGLTTYTYVFNELKGEFVFLSQTIGYGIPAATQYTNPEKYTYEGGSIPQADPNGLFSPSSAEGTWILMVMPSGKVTPAYIEPRIAVFTEKLKI